MASEMECWLIQPGGLGTSPAGPDLVSLHDKVSQLFIPIPPYRQTHRKTQRYGPCRLFLNNPNTDFGK